MQHIETLHNNGVIKSPQRLHNLGVLNHLIRYMNQDVYNARIKELKINQEDQNKKNIVGNQIDNPIENKFLADEFEIDSQDAAEEGKIEISAQNDIKVDNYLLDKPLCDILGITPLHYNLNTNIDALIDICKINKFGNIGTIFTDDFNKVNEKLIEMAGEVGFKSLFHALELLIGSSHTEFTFDNTTNEQDKNKSKDFRDMLTLVNETFIPTKFLSNDYKGTQLQIECLSINDQINNEISLQPCVTISICFPNLEKEFKFEGYFLNDPIQCIIRTSQIGRQFLYKKKKQLQQYVRELKTGFINAKFASIYIKNMSIGEILCYNKDQFVIRLSADYDRYLKYSKMTFRHLMEEFTKDSSNNLRNMYTIIKLLLLGPDDCIHMAGLLFGLTKDKKIGSEIVADLIYNNLTLPLQNKLKKSTFSIKNELDKIKNLSEEDVPLEKIVAANTKIPAKIKKIIFSKLNELKTQNTENAKNKLYADTLIRFPYIDDNTTFKELNKDQKKSCEFMTNVIKILNDKIYGHAECKNTIKELICSWILNPNKMGKAIALHGPPGVGKTLIAKALGNAIDVPVRCISLCGMEDGSVLNGHSFTYSNAQPGLLVREMCEAGKAKCILFFDEVDKTSKRHGIDEIQNILINLTDPNMNDKFNDKFIQDVHFDFSHVLIICTYNNRSSIDPILLNRLHEIEVKPYTIKDKLKITKDFLLREITEDIGLEFGSIKISDDDIKYLTENYTYESGVRELRRQIESLFLKLNVDRLYQKGIFACNCKKSSNLPCTCNDKNNDNICKRCSIICTNDCSLVLNRENPVTITHEMIIGYLPRPKIHYDKIHPYPGCGIVNGLYATTSGNGGLVTIVAQKSLTGGTNFELNLTGSQGKVMKESVNFARTTAMNLIKDEIIEAYMTNNKSGISVHALDGATNKDGPSAGCAFATAFISLILQIPIKNTIAMTGEIGIHGECKEIGGLVSKLYGAKKAGVTLVCIPKANEKDFEEIKEQDPELIEPGKFEVVICKSIYDILPNVLVGDFDHSKYLKPANIFE